jgi:hypothetical protein
MTKEPTAMYELLDAIEAAIKTADPTKREALAQTIEAYSEDCPDDFFWAVGGQSPTLLSHLIMCIDGACRPDAQLKQRSVVRLIDRKPEGSA